MLQRQVYRMPKAGNIDDLSLQTETLDAPGPDEVQVAVKAIGLNFADIFAMQGLYSATPKGPFIPGLEFAGEVLAAGPNVQALKPGDRVMGVTRFGGYVSHLNLNWRYLSPLPQSWSYAQGAGFLVQGLTAFYALTELGNLKPDQTVLIHSAAGGVGILANRICKKLGAYTIGTVGSANKATFLLQEEAYNKIIVRDNQFPERLRQALGQRPLNLVLECTGGDIFTQSWNALAPMGRLVTYGSASFTSHGARPNYPALIWKYLRRPKIDPLKLPTLNKSVLGFNLIYLYEQTDLMQQILNRLLALDLPPQHIGHVFGFTEMHQAIRLFQSGKTVGKVVVTVTE